MKTLIAWVVLIAIAVPLGSYVFDEISAQGGRLIVERQEGSRTVVLDWTGEVRHPMAAKIRNAFDQHARGAERFVLQLNSQGGELNEGARVIRTLTDMQRTHLVDTVVQAGDRCASMCVPIYLQGDVRAASHYSQFMFHEVRLADPIDGKPQPIDPREQSVITDGFVARFLDRRGVSKQWLARTREKMRGRDYWTTGERLMAEKSGIVTDLI